MRISKLTSEPAHRLPYCGVSQDGRKVLASLPILLGFVDELPPALDALVVTADLQGRACETLADGSRLLLGHALAQEFASLRIAELLPPPERIGVILAGDFYARPELDRRGGSGDVRPVWRAFARHARWVAGVAGNHDGFGDAPSAPALASFRKETGIHLLDRGVLQLDGLSIAGLSGIVGPPRKPFRHEEAVFVKQVRDLALPRPDLLILHDGPDALDPVRRGHPAVRVAMEEAPPTLVIRGHAHWDVPLAHLANGTQVLNVDGRVVILRRTGLK